MLFRNALIRTVLAASALLTPLAHAQLIPNCARILNGYRVPELSNVTSSALWDRDGAGPEQPLLVFSFDGALGSPFGTNSIVGWDGDRWVRIFTGNPTTTPLSGLFVNAGNLYGLSGGKLYQVTNAGTLAVTPDFGVINEAISFNGEIVICGSKLPPTKGVFALRGGAWVQIGAAFNNEVTSITAWEGKLVVAGSFVLPGLTNVRAAYFDGSSWKALGSSSQYLFTLQTTQIRAMGSRVLASNGVVLVYLEQGVWKRAPVNGVVIQSTDTRAYIKNDTGQMVVYDGDTWPTLNAPITTHVAEYQGKVYTGGASIYIQNYPTTAELANAPWNRFGEGPVGPISAMARALNGNLITASGTRSNFSDTIPFAFPFARAWDGFRFRPAGESFPGSVFHELTSDPEFDVLAGGSFLGGGNLPAYTVARYASDSAWGPFGSPLFNFAPGSPPVQARVFKLLRYRGELLALGEFSLTQLYDAASIARYQNGTWVPVAPSLALPTSGSRFRNAFVFDDKLFVVGIAVKGAGNTFGTFMYYDGAAWSQASNALRDVSTFAVHNAQLYAVANDRSTVVRWNGTGWDSLVPAPGGTTHALASYRGLLFAGGSFGLRYYNGSAWVTPANVNFSSAVYTLLEHNNELAIGGDSTTNFARFTADYVPPIMFQPTSRTGACGETTKLSVTIGANYGVTTYRWRKNGNLISDGPTGNGSTYAGAGTRELSIVNLKPDDAGSYECTLSVACGSRASTPAIVAVTCCPADLNNDLAIDDADFQLFAAAYDALICASPAMPVGCQADLNNDGVVDDADFVLFALAYDTLACP